MLGVGAISTQMWVSSPPISSANRSSNSICCSLRKPAGLLCNSLSFPHLPTFSLHLSHHQRNGAPTHFSPRAAAPSSAVGSSEYMEEPKTKVKFQTSLSLPGCSNTLSLIGTGYREKVIAVIGVKVYAAGFYISEHFLNILNTWRGRPVPDTEEGLALIKSIFQDPFEKSLQIVLVRDIDGKTFWDALDENVSPKIKEPTPVDESALSTFRKTFEGKPLKKGTSIFLTWLNPSKMLVSVSSNGLPSAVNATIQSPNVVCVLYDVFFGDAPVSPSLKTSVINGLSTSLNLRTALRDIEFFWFTHYGQVMRLFKRLAVA